MRFRDSKTLAPLLIAIFPRIGGLFTSSAKLDDDDDIIIGADLSIIIGSFMIKYGAIIIMYSRCYSCSASDKHEVKVELVYQ